ncbi:hypothetical protein PHYBOEH_010186 [Phytophthora boehmeriae]|uniref:SGNH hydrolase-type esterase domain-containing protein n=1 Tax=Phytophthora boehmeriae TaxID=109152 RepID=A0A8T1WXP8_9STRA|nr:hypothetical protein PHYBOEH_010186 [Phytophthora boehmeriae]
MVSFLRLARGLLLVATCTSYVAWSPEAREATIAAESAELQPNRPQVLITGDSITEQADDPTYDGYVTQFQYEFQQAVDVIVRGLSGYNSRWFLKYVTPVLEKELKAGRYTPSLITVWLGTNDAVLTNGSNAEMHVPVEDYTENMIKIVKSFQTAAPDANVLLITPPHVDDAARAKESAKRTDEKRGMIDRSNAMSGIYAQACKKVAAETGVPLMDLYSHFMAMPAVTRNKHLVDGLHFSASGHKVVGELLRKIIRDEFPDVWEKLLVYQFPFVAKWMKEDPYVPSNSTTTTN